MQYPEEHRICAFIDILGFSKAMLSNDHEKRQELISLLNNLAGNQTDYGHNTIDMGPGWVSHPSAEVTVFSDCVVISFPLNTLIDEKKVMGMNRTFEPDVFAHHMFAQITAASWKGLDLGVLFRGGITAGRLYHKGNVVAGEALVKAVCLEKDTTLPRIEINQEVLNLCSENGKPIFSDHFQEYCITKRDGVTMFDTCAFHKGLWRDYAVDNNSQSIKPAECLNIAEDLLLRVKQISAEHIENGNGKISEKWKWFESYFSDSLNTGIWQEIRSCN